MIISTNYVLVKRIEKPEEEEEGFKKVEVQDDFVYRGEIINLPEVPVFVSNKQLSTGDTILFHKYSPDSVEIDGNKFIKVSDILAVE